MVPNNLPTEDGGPIFDDWNPMNEDFQDEAPLEARHISEFTISEINNTHTETMHEKNMDQKSDKTKNFIFKTLAIVGLIVILGSVAWAGVNVARLAPSAFRAVASAFVGVTQIFIPSERIEASLDDALVTNGEKFVLSWKHVGKEDDGSYTFSYECRPGFHIEMTNEAGQDSIVFCNTPVHILDTDTEITMTPISTLERLVEIPLTISFTENGSSKVNREGSVTIRVANQSIEDTGITLNTTEEPNDTNETPNTNNTNNSGNTNTTNTNPATTAGTPEENLELFDETSGTTSGTSNPAGQPDLKATILAVGVVSRIDNSFTATSTIKKTDRVAVRFEIINLGTKETGTWHFNSVLPTFPSHIYTSKSQQNLLPGDRIEFTIGFDSIRDIGDNQIVINVDPTNSVKNEVTKDNNIVKTTIVVTE
jgi:hypothetical protein